MLRRPVLWDTVCVELNQPSLAFRVSEGRSGGQVALLSGKLRFNAAEALEGLRLSLGVHEDEPDSVGLT